MQNEQKKPSESARINLAVAGAEAFMAANKSLLAAGKDSDLKPIEAWFILMVAGFGVLEAHTKTIENFVDITNDLLETVMIGVCKRKGGEDPQLTHEAPRSLQ